MSDLIEREDAIDVHCGLCPDQFICCPVSNGNICPDVEVFNLIPSAHPQIKSAYLIDPNPYGKCSNCGQLIDIRDGYKFCPSCGARMDGESNE